MSGASVSVSPLYVEEGETITVTAHGLQDGANCTLSWEIFIDEAGPDFKWNIEGPLFFPISLDYADFRITNQNTATNKVTLTNDVQWYGHRELILEGDSVDGIWTGEYGVPRHDFINDTWPIIQNEGTILPGKTSVLTLIQWHGTKLPNHLIPEHVNGGPDDFSQSFSFTGVESGKVKFTIMVNGTNVATDTVIIGSGPEADEGSLLARSVPSKAQIYLDGVYYGVTPAVIGNVPPGLRTVTLEKDGSTLYKKQVMVYPNRLTTVIASLGGGYTPGLQTGSAYIRSLPSGATIKIDDNYYGLTPRILSGLPTGNHVLTLSKTGYADYTTTISIKARGVTTVYGRLTQSTSSSATQNIDVYSYNQPGGKAIGQIDPAELTGSNGVIMSPRLASILGSQG